MRGIDSQGRLLGRWGIVDLMALLLCLSLLPAGYYLYKTFARWEPELASIIPRELFTQDGGRLTLYGRNFTKGTRVKIGDIPIEPVIYDTPQCLRADLPRGIPPGMYSVTVTNPRGSSTIQWDSLWVRPEPADPQAALGPIHDIFNVSPSFLPEEGGEVLIEGKGFEPGSVLKVGDQYSLEVLEFSPSRIRARVPPGIPSGSYALGVTNRAGQTSYLYGALEVLQREVVLTLFIKLTRRDLMRLGLDRQRVDRVGNGQVRFRDVRARKSSSKAFFFSREEWLVAEVAVETDLVQKKEAVQFSYQGKVLDLGSSIQFTIQGITLTGTVVSSPIPIHRYHESGTYRKR